MLSLNSKLRHVAEDPINRVVFEDFKKRQRNRSSIHLQSLAIRLKKQGHIYNRDRYMPLAKAMADLGLGELIHDKKGNISGIKNINRDLRELGKAATATKKAESEVELVKEFMEKEPSSIQKILKKSKSTIIIVVTPTELKDLFKAI